jgi:hypothetical protein
MRLKSHTSEEGNNRCDRGSDERGQGSETGSEQGNGHAVFSYLVGWDYFSVDSAPI